MIGIDFRQERQKAGISGHLVCKRAGVCRSRLSDIERGYIRPSDVELEKLHTALIELIGAKEELNRVATKLGCVGLAL